MTQEYNPTPQELLAMAKATAIAAQKNLESITRLERLVLMHEKDRQVIWEGMEALARENNVILAEIKAMRRDQSKLIDELVYKRVLD